MMAANNLNTIELNIMNDWIKYKGNRLIGRCDRIRTYDPFTPSEVRYQAALHTDRSWAVYGIFFCLQR
jgi:hypothetical protein